MGAMKLWLRVLAAFGLGVFVHHEAAEVERALHPHGPQYHHGIWSPASHDLTLEHVEPVFPTIPPRVIEAVGVARGVASVEGVGAAIVSAELRA
jgi:hypothetical protein